MLSPHLLIKIPTSTRQCRARAKRENWQSREVPGRGGPQGKKTEFLPPKEILVEIQKFLNKNPNFFSEIKGSSERTTKYKSQPPQPLISESDKHERNIINNHLPLDSAVLENVLRQIECALEERKIILDAAKKASLIQLVYEHCVETRKNISETIERFLKLVS
ncbi:hypothetical protein AAW31_02125 [Nitrosomonas communis]|nr:hypothetical protein AAW31_02125 [Nitrosomonas communis]